VLLTETESPAEGGGGRAAQSSVASRGVCFTDQSLYIGEDITVSQDFSVVTYCSLTGFTICSL